MINSIEREFAQACCDYPMETISIFLSEADDTLIVMIFNLLVELEQSFMRVTYPRASMDLFDAAMIVLDTLTAHLGHTAYEDVNVVFPYHDFILTALNVQEDQQTQLPFTRENCRILYQGDRFDHLGTALDRTHFRGNISSEGTLTYEGQPFVCPL